MFNCSKARSEIIDKSVVVHELELAFKMTYRVFDVVFLTSITSEDCSNMNASSFITFVTYMMRQNGIRFYKGLYVTFKLTPDLKKNTVYLSRYSPLNEGYSLVF